MLCFQLISECLKSECGLKILSQLLQNVIQVTEKEKGGEIPLVFMFQQDKMLTNDSDALCTEEKKTENKMS